MIQYNLTLPNALLNKGKFGQRRLHLSNMAELLQGVISQTNNQFMTDYIEEGTAQEQHKDAAVKPEPKTLQTPDPQKKMEGPISSLVQGAKNILNDNKTKEQADEEKDRKM